MWKYLANWLRFNKVRGKKETRTHFLDHSVYFCVVNVSETTSDINVKKEKAWVYNTVYKADISHAFKTAKNHTVWPHDVQESRHALTRRAINPGHIFLSQFITFLVPGASAPIASLGRFSLSIAQKTCFRRSCIFAGCEQFFYKFYPIFGKNTLNLQCRNTKTSIGHNTGSIEDSALTFACSIGFMPLLTDGSRRPKP